LVHFKKKRKKEGGSGAKRDLVGLGIWSGAIRSLQIGHIDKIEFVKSSLKLAERPQEIAFSAHFDGHCLDWTFPGS
jgi:hypothetical protein